MYIEKCSAFFSEKVVQYEGHSVFFVPGGFLPIDV